MFLADKKCSSAHTSIRPCYGWRVFVYVLCCAIWLLSGHVKWVRYALVFFGFLTRIRRGNTCAVVVVLSYYFCCFLPLSICLFFVFFPLPIGNDDEGSVDLEEEARRTGCCGAVCFAMTASGMGKNLSPPYWCIFASNMTACWCILVHSVRAISCRLRETGNEVTSCFRIAELD